jgi:hypothetical protein
MFGSMLVVLKKTRRICFQLSMVSLKSQHGAGLMHNLQRGSCSKITTEVSCGTR